MMNLVKVYLFLRINNNAKNSDKEMMKPSKFD